MSHYIHIVHWCSIHLPHIYPQMMFPVPFVLPLAKPYPRIWWSQSVFSMFFPPNLTWKTPNFCLVGGLEHFLWRSICWEWNNHPNWPTPSFFRQKGTLSVPTFLSPTFLSPHVSQFPRFHMSGQTTWQITYESLLGKMLRLRNSCLWILVSLTSRLEEHLTLIIFLIHRKERATQKQRKNFFFLGWPPPLDGLSWLSWWL